MAEPISTALTVLSAFKEVYLISRFVYKTTKSARHFSEEKDGFIEELEAEILCLKSFWFVFQYHGRQIVPDEKLNEEWLKRIQTITKGLKIVFLEFTREAQFDHEYNEYVWFPGADNQHDLDTFPDDDLNHVMVNEVSEPEEANERPKNQWGWFRPIRENTARAVEGVKWSLFTKEKLEKMLGQFQRQNQRLNNLIPYITDSAPARPDEERRLIGDPKYKIFRPHLMMREHAQSREPELKKAGESLQIARPDSRIARRLVERKPFDANTNPLIGVYVDQLAVLLREAGSHNFRTLPFLGYMKDYNKSCVEFYFEYPANASDHEPKSLHDLISNEKYRDRVSLPQRFRIARAIAQSIGAFHSDGWVHKSIRSYAVKFFTTKDGKLDLDNPYLTNFEFSRPDGGLTALIEHGRTDPERAAYRHPDRDMYEQPTVSFNKVHDVYSLGIVLLEIGLWRPAGSMFEEARARLQAEDPNHRVPTNKSIKKGMKSFFGRELPHKMGKAYKDAVIACLSDDLEKNHLGQDSFAITFEKTIAERVDVQMLLE